MEGEMPFIRTADGATLRRESGELVAIDFGSPVPPLGTPEFRAFVQTPEWMEMRHAEALEYGKAWQHNRRVERQARIRQAFADDFRSRFPIDDPLRMDYEESTYGRSPAELQRESVDSLAKLSEAAILLTRIQRS